MRQIEIKTLAEFQKHVQRASHTQPVVAVVWADSCPPCATLKPKLAALSKQYCFPVVRINGLEARELALSLRVRSVPTVMVFNREVEVLRFSGDKSAEDLKLALARVGTFQQALTL